MNNKRSRYELNEIKLKSDHAVIYLVSRTYEIVGKAKIDLEDVEKVKDYKWCLTANGTAMNSEVGTLKRFILGSEPKSRHSHLNENKLDCRKHNLKELRKPRKEINQYTPNTIKIKEKYALVYLRNKKQEVIAKARISLKDVKRVSKYKWCCSGNGYAFAHRVGLLHRFVMRAEDGVMYDHKNRNKLDCRRSNLRPCTHKQNSRNTNIRAHNKLGIKGVNKQGNKFKVVLTLNRASIYLGLFDDPITAALVYNEEVSKLFGEFAVLNDINKLIRKYSSTEVTYQVHI